MASWTGKDLFETPLIWQTSSPCEHYSTVYAKHPVKIQSMSSSKIRTMLGKWREVSPKQLLPSISRFVRRNAKKHGVAIPNELKEYLEQLEASADTTVSLVRM